MKALSIKQPWAQLIIMGAKDVENRNRSTNFRGRFAVHVSLKRADYEDWRSRQFRVICEN
jgi:hypothetical protein